jgi:hypothetical protein
MNKSIVIRKIYPSLSKHFYKNWDEEFKIIKHKYKKSYNNFCSIWVRNNF